MNSESRLILKKEKQEIKDCCKPIPDKNNGFVLGIVYGILPHTLCIIFVILSIVGATAGATFMRRFLIVPYFFQVLVMISFVFAALSAGIYLKRINALSIAGLKKKWKYLTILFSTTIVINLLLFYVILPAAANVRGDISVNDVSPDSDLSQISGEQVVRMDQVGNGYKPNTFTVKKGVPVKWVITSKSPYSCAASIYSPKLGIAEDLKSGENVIYFTPKETGEFKFSCTMGMYSGKIIVIN